MSCPLSWKSEVLKPYTLQVLHEQWYLKMNDSEQLTTAPGNEFRDILLYSAIPAYSAFIVFGVIVGQNAVGALFMIIILLGQYAIKKTMYRCKVTIQELTQDGIYSSALIPISLLSGMHYLTNLFYSGINSPMGSVAAFILSYVMLFISVQTHVWFGFLEKRRQQKSGNTKK